MTKCDFCTQSTSKGKCLVGGFLYSPSEKNYYCEKAIKRMEEALQRSNNNDR